MLDDGSQAAPTDVYQVAPLEVCSHSWLSDRDVLMAHARLVSRPYWRMTTIDDHRLREAERLMPQATRRCFRAHPERGDETRSKRFTT